MLEVTDKTNPFRAYRTEQLESVWRFFVKDPFSNILGPKPLIYEGGRGSGKTMFFLCNSWRQRFQEIESDVKNSPDILKKIGLVGFYYRVDSPFVGSFYGKTLDEDAWNIIFSTYFNIVIAKEICLFLSECLNRNLFEEGDLFQVTNIISRKLRLQNEIPNINICIKEFDNVLDEIEYFSNSTTFSTKDTFRQFNTLLSPGSLIKEIVQSIKFIDCFKNIKFHIFIDEYETLNKSQQKQINTLIKMSQEWLVYDISVMNEGMKTFDTMTETIIQDPHDYTHFQPEMEIAEPDYENLIIKICEKRFKGFIATQIPSIEKHMDIKYYLNNSSAEVEFDSLIGDSKVYTFQERIKEIIYQQIIEPKNRNKYYKELAECSLINARMHLCLLLRGKEKNSVENIYNEYCNWKKGQSKVYNDWLHNMKLAVIFLLCRELNIPKQYHGFDIFILLSSGVIRYFLELCEHAFDFAFINGFSFDKPRPLSVDEQTRTVFFVSRYKVKDIEWLKPNGKVIYSFVTALANIFNELQTNSDVTLGEPEVNHFFTKSNELSENVNELLSSSIMHNVLQTRLPTKEKEGEASIETIDYYLNRIYCPHFEISYRRKRKVYISPEELTILFLGKSSDIKKTIKNILNRHKLNYNEEAQGRLFER